MFNILIDSTIFVNSAKDNDAKFDISNHYWWKKDDYGYECRLNTIKDIISHFESLPEDEVFVTIYPIDYDKRI